MISHALFHLNPPSIITPVSIIPLPPSIILLAPSILTSAFLHHHSTYFTESETPSKGMAVNSTWDVGGMELREIFSGEG